MRDKKYADFTGDYETAMRDLVAAILRIPRGPTTRSPIVASAAHPTNQPFRFTAISISPNDEYWSGGLAAHDPHSVVESGHFPFSQDCVYEFRVRGFVSGPDPTFNLTLLNSGDGPCVVSHVGVAVESVGYVPEATGAIGIPKAVKVPTLGKYAIQMPDTKTLLENELQRRGGYRAGAFAIPVAKVDMVAVQDPVYVQGKAPFRFDLTLKDYWTTTPPYAIVRFAVRVHDDVCRSDEVFMDYS